MMSLYLSSFGGQTGRSVRTALLATSGVCLAASGAGAQSALVPQSLHPQASGLPQAAVTLLAEGASGLKDLTPAPVAPASSSSPLEASLPEAPSPQLHKLEAPPATPETAQHVAPLYTSSIPAGYRAQPLTAHNKVVLGVRDLYSYESLGAIVLSAAYAHVTDGQPNYGVNSKAFAQRLGAAAARETSQGVFTEIVLDPLLHEDPRYYVKGPRFNPVSRTFYAITRPLVTKSDSGRSTINGALLIGYAGAAALTPLYYPQGNRNFHDVAATYGASLGGAALGSFVNEFADDVLTALHLKRLP